MERSYIEYKDKRYPIVEISANKIDPFYKDEPDYVTHQIADVELWNAIKDDSEKGVRKAVEIDNDIFYYCDSGFIASKPTEGEVIHYFKNVNL